MQRIRTSSRFTSGCLHSFSMGLVKQKTVIQVPQCVFGDPDLAHSLPTLDFTASQSRTCTAPSRALARRWSRMSLSRGGISDRSKRSRRSSQSASMICSFWAIGSVLTSSAVIAVLYRHCGGGSESFLINDAARLLSDPPPRTNPEWLRRAGRDVERKPILSLEALNHQRPRRVKPLLSHLRIATLDAIERSTSCC